MFTDKVTLQDFPKMDPEYQALLKRVLAIQADCEIGGPHLYVDDIMPTAPTKADQLMVAKTAAEELDHYRKIARLAGDIGEDVSYVLGWPNQKRYVEAFRGNINTWEDFAIFGFLIDRVGRYQLEEFMHCSYQPLAEILPKIIQEEVAHVGYGGSKAAELAAKGDESRKRLQKALDYWYAKALDMFGRSGSVRSERYRFWGLKRRSNEQARNQYIAEVKPLIEKLGLQVPAVGQERLYH
jgi:ring-1,2-phenylacetyl-CoA epoxidase subunit PaaA